MSIWDKISTELALWQNEGLPPARLWLRDDDAIEPTRGLDRLAEITGAFDVPVTIAVVPEPVDVSLAPWLEEHRQFSIALHGYAHKNHAPAGKKKCELGLHRGMQMVMRELGEGHVKLLTMFRARYINMLVPPWNRIDQNLLPYLAGIGLTSISTFTWQLFPQIPGLVQLNTQVDIIDWKGTRGGRAETGLVDDLLLALQTARRKSGAPVGVLTHHLVHDEIAWAFLADLFQFCAERSDVRWCQAASLVDGSKG